MKKFAVVSLTIFAWLAVEADGAFAQDAQEMTAGDLRQICIAPDAQSKSACQFYIFGVARGIDLGMSIADGKTQDRRRPCVPSGMDSAALELAVKMKMGQDLMVFPDDGKLEASGFVGAILISTFPCRQSN